MASLSPNTTASGDGPPEESLSVWFSAAREVELVREVVLPPVGREVTVQAIGSLVSRGTEILAYRGELPPDMPLGLETASGSARFPTKYGYQVVGRVVEAGSNSDFREDELVFARHPHQALFTMTTERGYVRRLPSDIRIRDALFLNLIEVSLGCVQDAPIRHGDVVVVFGLGIVGSIAAILAQQVATVIAVDPIERRRVAGASIGIETVVTPDDLPARLAAATAGRGADVVIEATGNPDTLQDCIEACGPEGTIVVVSFYGARSTRLNLNERFHFLRQRIVSSQIGAVGSGLQPRWDRDRRFQVTVQLAGRFGFGRLLSHEAKLANAAEAYRVLDEHPDEVVALAFNYGSTRLGEETIDV